MQQKTMTKKKSNATDEKRRPKKARGRHRNSRTDEEETTMYAAPPPVVDISDLPTLREAEAKLTEWITEADDFLAEAEIRRRVAVAFGTEIQRGADGRGYVIDNRTQPPMTPPYIKGDPAMATVPYLPLRVPSHSVKWTGVDAEVQRLIEETLGPGVPTRDVCRVLDGDLPHVRKRYNDVRSQMHAYARFANERRYAIIFLLGRLGMRPWPLLARPIERFTPHRLTELDAGDQKRGTTRYQDWMREIIIRHGRLGAKVPEPGDARPHFL